MLIFVSAGLLQPKKKFNISTASKHNYLNYGLLGIATVAKKETGIQTLVFHGGYNSPESIIQEISKYLDKDFPIFLSLPSFQSIEWAARFYETLKRFYPSQRVIVGGRWVCDGNGKWVEERLKNIDLIVFGTAEQRISKLVFPINWPTIHGTSATVADYREPPFNDHIWYDYKILKDYITFQPSIEVSRGCGMGCSFCVEANSPSTNLMPPLQVITAIKNINSIYRANDLNLYLEASFFSPNLRWASKFAEEYHKEGIKNRWRAETRVDSMDYNVLKCLANAGLTILDVGLESASPVQLTRMKKSKNPNDYLNKASRLLQNCKTLGIATKVNYLMYPGETINSYHETRNWLISHRSCITGMSCGPLIVYGPNESAHRYLISLGSYGATPVDIDSLAYNGYTAINISQEIDENAANELCLNLSRELMNDKEYFFLKSFSYFSRGFDYKEFRKIINTNAAEDFSFSVTAE